MIVNINRKTKFMEQKEYIYIILVLRLHTLFRFPTYRSARTSIVLPNDIVHELGWRCRMNVVHEHINAKCAYYVM